VPKLGKVLLVSGTDTGIGKTLLTAGLVRYLNNKGLSTIGMKPFACGAVRKCGQWVYEDLEIMKRANAPRVFPEELISPLRWRAPLAPYRAARLEKRPVSFEKVRKALKFLRSQADLILLEGVGGLLCPLTKSMTMADWAKQEGISLLIVARLGLGTLNHTLMTLEVAKARGIMVKSLILNDFPPVASDLSRRWNPRDLKELVNVPLLGIFPFLKPRTARTVEMVEASNQAWEKYFDLKRIKRSLFIK